MTATPETNRRRGAPLPYRRRGAPRGNRNALKSGRYTAEAKAERKRKRLLLRQLRAGLAYARSVIRARAAAAGLLRLEKNFQKSKNNSRNAGARPRSFAYAGIPGDAMAKWSPNCAMPMVWHNKISPH